jgi:hypothetical protein
MVLFYPHYMEIPEDGLSRYEANGCIWCGVVDHQTWENSMTCAANHIPRSQVQGSNNMLQCNQNRLSLKTSKKLGPRHIQGHPMFVDFMICIQHTSLQFRTCGVQGRWNAWNAQVASFVWVELAKMGHGFQNWHFILENPCVAYPIWKT